MQRKKFRGLAGLIGGTLLSAAGCVPLNPPPQITSAEVNGNTINPTKVNDRLNNDFCDVVYDLPVARGDLLENEFRHNLSR